MTILELPDSGKDVDCFRISFPEHYRNIPAPHIIIDHKF
jgi:hypothetical protein